MGEPVDTRAQPSVPAQRGSGPHVNGGHAASAAGEHPVAAVAAGMPPPLGGFRTCCMPPAGDPVAVIGADGKPMLPCG